METRFRYKNTLAARNKVRSECENGHRKKSIVINENASTTIMRCFRLLISSNFP